MRQPRAARFRRGQVGVRRKIVVQGLAVVGRFRSEVDEIAVDPQAQPVIHVGKPDFVPPGSVNRRLGRQHVPFVILSVVGTDLEDLGQAGIQIQSAAMAVLFGRAASQHAFEPVLALTVLFLEDQSQQRLLLLVQVEVLREASDEDFTRVDVVVGTLPDTLA